MEQGYNLKRVHKVNMIAIIGISLIFIISILAAGASFSATYSAFGVIVITVIIYFIPMNAMVKGLVFALIPTLSSTLTLMTTGFAVSSHYIYFIAICIVALYFEWKVLVAYGAILNIVFILMYMVNPSNFLSSGVKFTYFISTIVMLNGAMILLFFLTSWGKKSIINAVASSSKANEAMSSLTVTLEHIEDGTTVLSENTTTMTQNASDTLVSSQEVATAIKEIATGVQEQAQSVSSINTKVADISGDVEEAYNISQNITEYNEKMMNAVTSGEEQVKEMNGQMTIIDGAINAAIVTVQDLETKLGDIQNFLEVITTISTQTNLLALNASIESARAGEAGKGFAVVADEIRKLAEQTSESVNDINDIVSAVGAKSKEAVETVNQGNDAVGKGTEIIGRITSQYSSIKETFSKSNTELDREIQMINQINEVFADINDRITNIASISEEQSASSEEILSTVENQKDNIQYLTTSLQDIENVSGRLTQLIDDHNQQES